MAPNTILLIIIALLIIALLFIFLARSKNKKHTPNYKALFSLGIIFLVMGLGTDNTPMWVIGLVLFIVGYLNKDKWEKESPWKKLSKKQKQARIFILTFLLILLVAAIGVFFYTEDNEVTNFEECVEAGNPVMESYPRQCRHKDSTFTEQLSEEELRRINP